MDTAFENTTKKLVKAWIVNKDTSYIKPKEDLFIANKDYILNYDDVLKKNKIEYIEVRYKNGHPREYKPGLISRVVPHFFILNKKKLGVKMINESPEHRKIKRFIYNIFFNNNNEIKFIYSKYKRKEEIIENTIKLIDLEIDFNSFSIKSEDFFEVSIIDTYNTRRVDLFLPFKKFNSLFGEGLVIEVQLTPQSKERTKERTLDRALKGYSTIWINKNNFIDHKAEVLELKEKNLNINSWHSEINKSSDIICDELYTKIKKYSRDFDRKCSKTLKEIKKGLIVQEGMLCPICGKGQLIIKNGKNGKFLGCKEYKNTGCPATYKIINLIQKDIKE